MSVFVVIFSVVVFLLAGMLVDGGAAINARLRAADVAEQGARAAADQIDEEHLRETGQVQLPGDDAEVCDRAEEIVTAHDDDRMALQECSVGDDLGDVTVTVSVRWEAFFLAALGFQGTEMEASATAGPDAGESDGIP
jgi:Flp pilus assembly protein TadG